MTEVAEEIDKKLKDLADWRGETLGKLRSIIRDAHPRIVEEIKWRKPSKPSGVPVWSLDGMICTGEVYKNAVKLTFAHGASLNDPAGLFNASMAGGTRRAIDYREHDTIDEATLGALVGEAVSFNQAKRGA